MGNILLQANKIISKAIKETYVDSFPRAGILGSSPLKVTIETLSGTIIPNILVWDRMADQIRQCGIGANVRLSDGMKGSVTGRITAIS